MAASYVNVDEEVQQELHSPHDHHQHHNQQQHHYQAPSPRSLRRTLSSNSSTASGATCDHGAPKCVCAPATHARSFKCRLHRANSVGRAAPSAPMPPPPSVSSSTRTVEAQ